MEASLLALIHQHLLQAGYSKAARELQAQNGKKFSSSDVSLQQIYTDWAKRPHKAKKRKAGTTNNTEIKKQRVPDPESSSETSEDDDDDDEETAAIGATKVSDKKDLKKQSAKVKTSSTAVQNMNSVKNAKTKAKILPKIPAKPVTVKTAASESSDSSDSEEETTPPKSAALPATLKHDAVDTKSTSSSSDSEMETEQPPVPTPKLPTPANSQTTKGNASPAKAAPKPDVDSSSESSESDSEEEPVKQPQVTAAVVQSSQKKAPTNSSQTRQINPLHSTKAAESSESSDSSDSDEEAPVKKSAAPVPASQGKSSTATKPIGTPKPLLGKTTKVAAPVKPTNIASPVKATVALKQILAPETSDSSDSSDSEEEPETKASQTVPVKNVTPKVSLPAKSPAAKAASTKTMQPPPIKESKVDPESSDTSDSEEEQVAVQTKPATVSKPVHVPTRLATPTASQVKAAKRKPAQPAKVAVVTPSHHEDSSDTTDSSEDEKPSTVVKPVLPTTVGLKSAHKKVVTSVMKPILTSTQADVSTAKEKPTSTAKNSVTVTPKATEASDSSDTTDIDEKMVTVVEAPTPHTLKAKQGKQTPKPVITASKTTAKGKLPPPVLTPTTMKQIAADSSDSSDSSDNDEEPQTKKPATPLKAVTPGKVTVAHFTAASAKLGKTTPAKTTPAQPVAENSSDSSESSNSDDEETSTGPQTPAPMKKKEVKSVLTPIPSVTPSIKSRGKAAMTEVSDSSDSSDSEEEPAAQATPQPPANVGTKKTKPQSAPPGATRTKGNILSPLKTPTPVTPAADESSDSSSSESEEELAAKATPQLTSNVGAKKTKLQSAPSGATRTKGTILSPLKIPTPVTPAADETSDSSSESEEEVAAETPVVPLKVTTPNKAQRGTSAHLGTGKRKRATLVPVTSLKSEAVDKNSENSDSSTEDEATSQFSSRFDAYGRLLSNTSSVNEKSSSSALEGAALHSPAALPTLTKSDRSSEDTSDSELDNSQALIKTPVPVKLPQQQLKRPPKTNHKQTIMGATGKTKKNKPVVPAAYPTPAPVADSEEETVMALLKGESPKKTKTKVKKKAAGTVTSASLTLNNNLKGSQPAHELLPAWKLESPSSGDEKLLNHTVTSPQAPAPTLGLLPPSTEKLKKSKKRKVPTEEVLSKKMAKLAKKAKKESKREKKRLKLAGGDVGIATPKKISSKKDKKHSEKTDKKKSNKKKKELKDQKKRESGKVSLGNVGGAADPMIGAVSKPKRKKKTKAEKMSVGPLDQ